MTAATATATHAPDTAAATTNNDNNNAITTPNIKNTKQLGRSV